MVLYETADLLKLLNERIDALTLLEKEELRDAIESFACLAMAFERMTTYKTLGERCEIEEIRTLSKKCVNESKCFAIEFAETFDRLTLSTEEGS